MYLDDSLHFQAPYQWDIPGLWATGDLGSEFRGRILPWSTRTRVKVVSRAEVLERYDPHVFRCGVHYQGRG